ncbi:Hpt domain-containing protein [Pseudohaliea rubra]|uniref:HPt domain-containing protein n=1 Tax=Pseudohaliea rubra DSM 19751 TaxID=1265313 RepID=A0A095X327_9GAMM|nr:Hpt domain-containing protein [Pseudohaliea rubra]KGE05279.1 hypothetical protein HRUBRA_00101 [Pseudohaliea rubra DSM 19751]
MSRGTAYGPDQKQLARLRTDLGSETLTAILAQCHVESGERLAALREALALGERETAAREAHTLAGLQRSVGLPALGEAFATLEGGIETGEQPDDDRLDALAAALAEGHRAAQSFLGA